VIRVVLAVALAVALAAATLPAVDAARRDRGAAAAERAVERLDDAGQTLTVRDAAVRAGQRGARRVVRLCLPRRSWTTAGVASFAVDTGPAGTAEATYRVGDGRTVTRRLSVPLRPTDPEDDDADGRLSLGPGCHRLVLSLVRRGATTVVAVRRG